MTTTSIEMADYNLVEIKTTNECKPTPHCKKHGAMNKVTKHEDGGGIWRCFAAHSVTKISKGSSVSYKENDTVCRAGCLEIKR